MIDLRKAKTARMKFILMADGGGVQPELRDMRWIMIQQAFDHQNCDGWLDIREINVVPQNYAGDHHGAILFIHFDSLGEISARLLECLSNTVIILENGVKLVFASIMQCNPNPKGLVVAFQSPRNEHVQQLSWRYRVKTSDGQDFWDLHIKKLAEKLQHFRERQAEESYETLNQHLMATLERLCPPGEDDADGYVYDEADYIETEKPRCFEDLETEAYLQAIGARRGPNDGFDPDIYR